MRVVRDIGKADDNQLTAIRESATRLLADLQPFMGGDLTEALCFWREAAQKMQDRRAQESAPADSVHQFRPRKVG
jgi:hypothetical protein